MVSERAKKRNNIIITVLVGAGLVVAGIVMLTGTSVNCGSGDPMRPGDVCEETRRGRTTTYTYEERRAYWNRMGSIATGGGVLFLGWGTWLIVKRRREVAAEATT